MLVYRSLIALLVTFVLAFALTPAAALGQGTNAPPGNSAIDEYLETIPGSTGDRPATGSPAGSDPSVLTPAQRKRLDALGKDGRVLADAVEQTTPRASGSGSVSEGTGRSPLSSVVDAVGGDDGGSGLGAILPLILLATLLAMLAALLVRRRSSSS